MSKENFEAILVCGTGINPDGSLTLSAIHNVKKSIELFLQKKAPLIVYSGKWAWNYNYIPSKTEASAMKNLAISLGINSKSILTEEESNTWDQISV